MGSTVDDEISGQDMLEECDASAPESPHLRNRDTISDIGVSSWSADNCTIVSNDCYPTVDTSEEPPKVSVEEPPEALPKELQEEQLQESAKEPTEEPMGEPMEEPIEE